MIRTVAETGSTNADLATALRSGEALREGDWLVADRQSAGRGRQGRQWFDGIGNFAGSTVVRVALQDPPPSSLALVAGLAVFEAVARTVPGVRSLQLKWPNDLMVGGAKLAGVLLEREGETIIVGIGVNLAAAPALPDRETIALTAFGPAPDRDHFAQILARTFDEELERWRMFGLETLTRRWEVAAHPRGTLLTVQSPGEAAISGEYDGLTCDGLLRLRLADGSSRVIHAGDVSLATRESR